MRGEQEVGLPEEHSRQSRAEEFDAGAQWGLSESARYPAIHIRSQAKDASALAPPLPDATAFLRRCCRHGLACHRPPGVLLSTAFPFARVLAFKAKMKWLFSYLPINCLMKCLCRNEFFFFSLFFLLLSISPLIDLA